MLALLTRKNHGLRGKGFSKQAPILTCLQVTAFENTVEKGEIARNEQFLLFPKSFLFIWRTFCRFQQNRNRRLQILVWKSLEFVVWKELSPLFRKHDPRRLAVCICFQYGRVQNFAQRPN